MQTLQHTTNFNESNSDSIIEQKELKDENVSSGSHNLISSESSPPQSPTALDSINKSSASYQHTLSPFVKDGNSVNTDTDHFNFKNDLNTETNMRRKSRSNSRSSQDRHHFAARTSSGVLETSVSSPPSSLSNMSSNGSLNNSINNNNNINLTSISSGPRTSLWQHLRQAFSITDHYMPAQTRDLSYSNHNSIHNWDDGLSTVSRPHSAVDDDDFDHDDDDEDDLAVAHGRSWLYMVVAMVLALMVLSIGLTTSRRQPMAYVGGNDSSYCADAVLQQQMHQAMGKYSQGAVASDHPVCSQLGLDIMQTRGGNAIDAAVTVALCLGVANPASSGIGGGAFILVHADADIIKDVPIDNLPLFHDARTIPASPVSESGKITEVIDCREVAPAAAYTEMYVSNTDTNSSIGVTQRSTVPVDASTRGGLAVGVPGELRGLELAHARHGKLSWSQVVAPVQQLAANGVVVNANLAKEIRGTAQTFIKNGAATGPTTAITTPAALDTSGVVSSSTSSGSLITSTNSDGTWNNQGLSSLLTRYNNWKFPYKQGDILVNTKLAETLQLIQDHGADVLYQGPLAESLAQDIQDAGGVITAQDLHDYQPTLRSPVVAYNVQGYTLVGVPPPSSGGAAIMGAARFLSGYAIPLASLADTLFAHWLVEACKHVFGMRMSLSDPLYHSDMVKDVVNDLTTGGYMESLRKMTLDNDTLPLSMYGGPKWAKLSDNDGDGEAQDAQEGDRRRRLARRFGYLEDSGTTHFSVVDKDGNAVAMTSSVNTIFGSKVVSPSTGILLNNQMDDFATPGKANHFGLKPAEANFIQPGKIPLSSMSPTMVFKSAAIEDKNTNYSQDVLGNLTLVVGASGGPKIITAVLQVIIYHMLMGKSLFDAVIYPRLHEQLIYHGAHVVATEKATISSGSSGMTEGPTIEVSTRTKQALERRHQELLDIDYAGAVQAVSIDLDTQEMTAVCDVRKGGSPAGY